MEMMNKRKADDDQQKQPAEKSKNEQEGRGAKRSTDDWETFAKDLKAGAERRAEENKRAKVGEDLDNDAMREVMGAAGVTESDLSATRWWRRLSTS